LLSFASKDSVTFYLKSREESMLAGEKLKELRNRLGITTRDVEEYSRKIAQGEENDNFYISNAWLTQIENTDSVPGIHKLFSLSVIYRTNFSDLLSIFGVNLSGILKYELSTPLQKTHLTKFETPDTHRKVSFPVRFDPGFSVEKSCLISRMVEVWGEVPIPVIQALDFRHSLYGFIGLSDFTLYPLLRPGSFVQIDDELDEVQPGPWKSELERPIYFIELRDGYACSWCELHGNQLILVPHPLSPCSIRQFACPDDAEIVGQVTAVAMRIVDYSEDGSRGIPKLPKRS
jgi:transcriptional regulator with XRE-family HTH domain